MAGVDRNSVYGAYCSQGCHLQFLAGKAPTVVTTSAASRRCRPRFLFCKIQARPRPWGALPAVAALYCFNAYLYSFLFFLGFLNLTMNSSNFMVVYNCATRAKRDNFLTNGSQLMKSLHRKEALVLIQLFQK